MSPLDTTKRQVAYSTGQLRESRLRGSYDFPQIPSTFYQPSARVSSCSHGEIAMLFCSSFTQSERFLQTDQLIIRLPVVVLHVDEKRIREGVQVRCSDLVGSDLPHASFRALAAAQ